MKTRSAILGYTCKTVAILYYFSFAKEIAVILQTKFVYKYIYLKKTWKSTRKICIIQYKIHVHFCGNFQ